MLAWLGGTKDHGAPVTPLLIRSWSAEMTEGVKVVIVGGFLLVTAALAFGGLYTVSPIGNQRTFVLNRLTGTAWVCRSDLNWKCLPVGEAPSKTPLDVSGLKPLNPFDQFDAPTKAPLDH
jgi:hypothetical protein